MTITCDPRNVRCLKCSKAIGCDVMFDMKSFVTSHENDRSVTIRVEVPECSAFSGTFLKKLDDFLKI